MGLLSASPAMADRWIGNYIVGGAIEVEYDQAGGYNKFGNPTTPESNAADFGRFQVFERSNSIYWHSDTGAHQIGGRIRDKWGDFGWETGSLHYPTTRELPTPQGQGVFNHFQGGSIYWSPATDAHQIWGMVRDQWAVEGWENSPYGFPRTDEYTNPSYSDGFKQDFENGTIEVVDMKVPAYGYVDPTVATLDTKSLRTEEGSESTPPSSATTSSTDPSSPAVATEEIPPTDVPVPNETSVKPTPPASILPTTPGVPYPLPSSGDAITSKTWPFGDFCVLGTYGGPGGACRFGDGIGVKEARCMASIVVAAGTLAIPASKVLQFRNFVTSVGGAKEAFQLWRGASLPGERALAWSQTGKITLGLATEFLALDAIADNCR
ncbi:LGFP repeat-containing protein [Rhodococcus marinonascens]|uniref:LGFP repeat-containing protein n=1 Tax=Rhodococcus marinonascens TaxID=38311 RepID=UPI000A0514FE|nr:hypothetical protein [Rhodococcus marinonascens]